MTLQITDRGETVVEKESANRILTPRGSHYHAWPKTGDCMGTAYIPFKVQSLVLCKFIEHLMSGTERGSKTMKVSTF